MSENKLALLDQGEANRRILAKDQYRADFRRVEAASVKRKTWLASAEGKRIFARCFYSFQASMYVVSTLGRTKLPHDYVEQIESAVRAKVEQATREINQALDAADALFKAHSIDSAATYDTQPLQEEIGITSALGRRYFELIHKLDQLMPLLQTLEIEEVITERQIEQERSKYKRLVLSMSSTARNFAAGCRRRMNEVDAKREEQEGRKAASSSSTAETQSDEGAELSHEGGAVNAGDSGSPDETLSKCGSTDEGSTPTVVHEAAVADLRQ
jgi:hypothetical protein